MDKPIVVERHDFVNALAETVNAYNLPAFVKVEVVERLLSQLKSIERQELQRETVRYMRDKQQEQEITDKEDAPCR